MSGLREDVAGTAETGAGVPVVALESVTVAYGGPEPLTALSAVSLGLAPGTFAAVLAPHDTGRGTLLRCAAGMVKPSAGTVRWRGGDTPPANRVVALLSNCRPSGRTTRDMLANTAPELIVAEEPIVRASPNGRERKNGDAGQSGEDTMHVIRMALRRHNGSVLLGTTDAVLASRADIVLFLLGGRFVDVMADASAAELAQRWEELYGAPPCPRKGYSRLYLPSPDGPSRRGASGCIPVR